MSYATVKVGGMELPLLGIPESATQEHCDYCPKIGHLTDIHITQFGHFACSECLSVILQVTANLDANFPAPPESSP